MNRDITFPIPGNQVTGDEITRVLRALTTSKEAAAYACDSVDMDHRTHQQSLMRLFIFPLMKRWATRFMHKQYDDRNRNTVYFAALAVNSPDQQEVFPYI